MSRTERTDLTLHDDSVELRFGADCSAQLFANDDQRFTWTQPAPTLTSTPAPAPAPVPVGDNHSAVLSKTNLNSAELDALTPKYVARETTGFRNIYSDFTNAIGAGDRTTWLCYNHTSDSYELRSGARGQLLYSVNAGSDPRFVRTPDGFHRLLCIGNSSAEFRSVTDEPVAALTRSFPVPVMREASYQDASTTGRIALLHTDNYIRIWTIGNSVTGPALNPTTWKMAAAAPVDWCGVSPDGQYLLVQYASSRYGLRSYAITQPLQPHVQIHNHTAHGCLDYKGGYWTVQVVAANNNNESSLVCYDIATGALQHAAVVPWGSTEHICARGPDDLVVLSATHKRPDRTLSGYIWTYQPSTRTATVLAEHRSSYQDNVWYWGQAQATISPDGKCVLFGTDFEASRFSGQIIELA